MGVDPRQHQRERAATADFALDRDRTTVCLDDALDQRKPDTDAANARTLRFVAADELLEHALLLGHRYADATVFNPDHDRGARALRKQPDRTLAGRILRGVLQQVPDRARKSVAIALERRRLVVQLNRERSCGELAAERLGDIPDGVPYGQGLQLPDLGTGIRMAPLQGALQSDRRAAHRVAAEIHGHRQAGNVCRKDLDVHGQRGDNTAKALRPDAERIHAIE